MSPEFRAFSVFFAWLGGRVAGWLGGWAAGLLGCWAAGWLGGWVAGWLGGRVAGWLGCRVAGLTVGRWAGGQGHNSTALWPRGARIAPHPESGCFSARFAAAAPRCRSLFDWIGNPRMDTLFTDVLLSIRG
jgi:hypothetical protein